MSKDKAEEFKTKLKDVFTVIGIVYVLAGMLVACVGGYMIITDL